MMDVDSVEGSNISDPMTKTREELKREDISDKLYEEESPNIQYLSQDTEWR